MNAIKHIFLTVLIFHCCLLKANDFPPDRHFCVRMSVQALNSFNHVTRLFGVDIKKNIRILLEALTPLLTHQNYEGMTLNSTDRTFKFRIEGFVGKGWWGVVHKIKITEAHPILQKVHPELFKDGKIRDDLVVKLARRDSIVELARKRSGIIKEAKLTRTIAEAIEHLNVEPFVYPKILITSDGAEPFLVKSELVDIVEFKEILREPQLMTEEMLNSLERDIFNKAKLIYQKTGLSLDIQPGNIAWDIKQKRWVLFELQNIYGDYWVGGNFFDFLQSSYELKDKDRP